MYQGPPVASRELLEGHVVLNVREFGAIFGVKESQARNILTRNPQLVRRIGRRVVIPARAVERWLDEA